jgi:hypothetical protein
LSILPSPIPELQHAPLPLKVLWARERAPTPPPSAIFHLDSHLSPSRSWECVTDGGKKSILVPFWFTLKTHSLGFHFQVDFLLHMLLGYSILSQVTKNTPCKTLEKLGQFLKWRNHIGLWHILLLGKKKTFVKSVDISMWSCGLLFYKKYNIVV